METAPKRVDYRFLAKVLRRHVLFGVVPTATLVDRMSTVYGLDTKDRVRLRHVLSRSH